MYFREQFVKIYISEFWLNIKEYLKMVFDSEKS
jgi:hypothetical protein